MKYSSGFKQGILRKVLPPESWAVTQLSKEMGIAEQTIRNWMERARNGTLESENGEIALDQSVLSCSGKQSRRNWPQS